MLPGPRFKVCGGSARIIWWWKPIFLSNPTGVRLGYVGWSWSWVGVVTILILLEWLYPSLPSHTNQTKLNQTKPNQTEQEWGVDAPIFILNAYLHKIIVLTKIQPCQCCLGLDFEFVWSSTAYMVEQQGLYGGLNQFSCQTQLELG